MSCAKWVGAFLCMLVAVSCRGSAGGNEAENPSGARVAESRGPREAVESTAEESPSTRDEPREAVRPTPSPALASPEVESSSENDASPSPAASESSQPEQATPEADTQDDAGASQEEIRPERLEPELVETEGLRVVRIAVARGVEEREPVDPGTSFSAAEVERVYAFLEVANPERTECEITVAWAPTDDLEDERGRVSVNVGPQPRWRTWSYTSRLGRPGRYMAIVRDPDGRVIARAPFDITP